MIDHRRIGLLVRDETFAIGGKFLLSLAVYAIACLLSKMLNNVRIVAIDDHESAFLSLSLLGFAFGSMAFSDLGRKDRRVSYLTLPASEPEKYLAKIIVYFLGIGAILALAAFLLSASIWPTALLLRGAYPREIPAFDPDFLWDLAFYAGIQAYFIYASAFFDGLAGVKALGLLLGACAIVVSGIGPHITDALRGAASTYASSRSGFSGSRSLSLAELLPYISQPWDGLLRVGSLLLAALPAPLFLTLSYLRLKRAEG